MINSSATQRNTLEVIEVTFSEDVTLDDKHALELWWYNDGQSQWEKQTQAITDSTYNTTSTTAKWEISTSLSDGHYMIKLVSSKIEDDTELALDGDDNGQAGGDYLFRTHELAGDIDGDGAQSADDIDKLKMRGKLFVKPARAVEEIEYDLILTPAGADFSEVRVAG